MPKTGLPEGSGPTGLRTVAGERPGVAALARGDDDEVARIHLALEIVDGRCVDHETASARLEMLEQARILDALVDGLARPVEPRGEVESLLASNLGMRDRELDALRRRAGVGPEV